MLADFVSQNGSEHLDKILLSLKRWYAKGHTIEGMHEWHDFFLGLFKVERTGRISFEPLKMALVSLYTRKIIVRKKNERVGF